MNDEELRIEIRALRLDDADWATSTRGQLVLGRVLAAAPDTVKSKGTRHDSFWKILTPVAVGTAVLGLAAVFFSPPEQMRREPLTPERTKPTRIVSRPPGFDSLSAAVDASDVVVQGRLVRIVRRPQCAGISDPACVSWLINARVSRQFVGRSVGQTVHITFEMSAAARVSDYWLKPGDRVVYFLSDTDGGVHKPVLPSSTLGITSDNIVRSTRTDGMSRAVDGKPWPLIRRQILAATSE